MVEKLPITNDFVFTSIFGKKGNEKILKNLVEAIIGVELIFSITTFCLTMNTI